MAIYRYELSNNNKSYAIVINYSLGVCGEEGESQRIFPLWSCLIFFGAEVEPLIRGGKIWTKNPEAEQAAAQDSDISYCIASCAIPIDVSVTHYMYFFPLCSIFFSSLCLHLLHLLNSLVPPCFTA